MTRKTMRIILGLSIGATLAACGQDRTATTSPSRAPAAEPVIQATASTPPESGAKPQTRRFRDWYAVCDNGNRCAAYTGADAGGWLMVRMDAGPQARAQVLAGMSAFAGADTVEGVVLTLDGHAQRLGPGPENTRSLAIPAGDVPAVLTRLAAARTMSLGLGEVSTDLPTAGASAALLWIDETQGRLGTTTALIRRGPGDPATAAAPPALPDVTAAHAARAPVSQRGLEGATDPLESGDTAGVALPAALEALEDVKACRADTNDYLRTSVLAARLDEGIELWGVPCSSGAYNASYAFYVTGANGANPRKAVFPTWAPPSPAIQERGEDWLVNPTYDVATRTLSHFPRGRGIGDCGVQQSWTWNGGGFTLREERVMGECWGMSPALWPTTWRSR